MVHLTEGIGSMSDKKSDQCVCGKVSYTVVGEPARITICHCK